MLTVDKNNIGLELEPLTVEVEAGRLRFFAKATGQTDPVYLDEAAAQAAGYRTLPAPPTFIFSLELEQADPFKFIKALNIDISRVLHAEQSFVYNRHICAGDTITLKSRVEDIYDKKGGALEFVVMKTLATDQNDISVAEMTRLLVVRN